MASARFLLICTNLLFIISLVENVTKEGKIDIDQYREKVKRMFYHAYNGYIEYAYPYDELRPLTCDGHDTWGSYSLTLIDALDTLLVMGNYTEFRRVSQILIDKSASFFDMDINVSVFETNIRVVGGLLSAHLMMKKAEMVLEPGWPCSGPLLRMAENIARKILPAFDTPTGMPYGTVNLRHGVPTGETTVTCTAGVGTFIIEFGALSRLTGDPIFEKVAMRAIRALWNYRSSIGLLGNHIDVSTGKWTALDSGIGGGVDSYFEYLVKGAIMFNNPELLEMFREYESNIVKHLKRDDWYMWAHMKKGGITLPLFTSLDAYWPGIQSMLGDIDSAMKTIHNFHQVWQQFGATPEYYNIPKAEVHSGREGYPLRPELIESVVYLYQATRDPILLQMGVDMVEAIEHIARTSCGYATVKDVRDHRIENRMESFFLAETAKYLYLLFDPDNFLHNTGGHGELIHTPSGECVISAGGYIFNTEAHPLDLAAIHCCSAEKKEAEAILQSFHDNLNLLELLDIGLETESKKIGKKLYKRKKQEKQNLPEFKMDTVESEIMKTNSEAVTLGNINPDNSLNTTDTPSFISEALPLGKLSDETIEELMGPSDSESREMSGSQTEDHQVSVEPPLSSNIGAKSAVQDQLPSDIESQDLTNTDSEPQNEVESQSETQSQPQSQSETQPSTSSGQSVKIYSEEITLETGRKKQTFELAQQILDLFSSVGSKVTEQIVKKPNMSDLYAALANYSIAISFKPHIMRCPAQPFHSRLSVWGEMFEDVPAF